MPMPPTWLAAQGGIAAVTALMSPAIMPMHLLQDFIKFCNQNNPPPRVNGPGHVSSFERGGPLARGAMFLLSKRGVH